MKPEYRRNQFGGTLGGPLVRDRTFFFVDYQGQRQSIGRTVISTVPTLLQRQGIFTEAIAGRVPVIYDPATTVGSVAHAVSGQHDSAGPDGSGGAGAAAALSAADLVGHRQQLSAGPTNEIDDQDQWDVRIDHRFASNRDQVFGRLSYFRDGFVPVTPLPDGSGVTTGTLGPQDTTAWAFASNYQHTFSANAAERAAHRRHAPDGRTRRRRSSRRRPARRSAFPAFRRTRSFPNTLPTFLIGGYQQLGSPPNTASDFNTSVSEVADSLTWLKGRHTLKMGLDWRWERLERHPAAVADRIVHVQRHRQRSAGRRQHRHAARELPARPGAAVLDRSAAVDRSRSGRTSRSTSSRTTGRSPTASRSIPACATR